MPKRPHPRRRRFVPSLTVVETTVLTTILVTGILALTATSLTASSLRRAAEEQRVAHGALRSMIEEVQRSAYEIETEGNWSADFVATYSSLGPVGDSFPVQGLIPWSGQEEVGSIRVITDETLTDEELGVRLGLPIDLDENGRIDDQDVRDTARVLPVLVRIAWNGAAGPMEIKQAFFVLSRAGT